MHYICTERAEEQRQLELEFSSTNNYYLVPNKHSNFVSEMLGSICFEFFQNDTPVAVDKIKEMLISSFNSSYSLTTFREIIALLKKEREEIRLFKDYLIEMNRAFAQPTSQVAHPAEEMGQNCYDQLFEQANKGSAHFLQNLEQLQLPLQSQLDIKCSSEETKTDKTVQSDLCSTKIDEVTILNVAWNSATKLSNFFNQPTFSSEEWKTDRKLQQPQNNSSDKQLSSFRKRGSTIIDSNKDLSRLLFRQMEYDLTRQINLVKNVEEKKHIQIEKFNYQRKIKSALVNHKLKMRKK